MFRITSKNTQEEIMHDIDLMKNMPYPEQEELKLCEEEGLAGYDDSAIAILEAALQQYREDRLFQNQRMKVEKEYEKIFNRYRLKM